MTSRCAPGRSTGWTSRTRCGPLPPSESIDLAEETGPATVAALLAEARLPGSNLGFEITESVLMGNLDQAATTLEISVIWTRRARVPDARAAA